MAGIYIHIPFCKQLCHYCDFYRTKDIALLPSYLEALKKEMDIRRGYLGGEKIESIYFGGGTPSLLNVKQIGQLLRAVQKKFQVVQGCEITFEANPDDLSVEFLKELKNHTTINRLSIGIQSFSDDDLKLLNRRHDAYQSISCIEQAASAGFDNLSIDLIFGIPGVGNEKWEQNLNQIPVELVRHLSAYHLTIEPGTIFHKMAKQGIIQVVDEETSQQQYNILCEKTRDKKFIHYEISNFCREGFQSFHNSAYWKQKRYLGLGPSAHSYDKKSRQWNISDVKAYMKALHDGTFFYQYEESDQIMQYNEYLLVSLRTVWGVNLKKIQADFGRNVADAFKKKASRFLDAHKMICLNEVYTITEDTWLIADYIISSLMLSSGGSIK